MKTSRVSQQLAETVLPRPIVRWLKQAIRAWKALRPIHKRSCNLCNYHGYFGIMGRPARLDAKCPRCDSLERHRLLALALDRGLVPVPSDSSCDVLHFAAEPVLEKLFRKMWTNYRTADLYLAADLTLDLENIDLPNESIDLIVANHVLEHVDDYRAAQEFNRILRPGGILICMVPIIEGWDHTYENDSIVSENDRLLHFGQKDHVRFYGRDFPQRIERGGFTNTHRVTAETTDILSFGLLRGEKVFAFEKI